MDKAHIEFLLKSGQTAEVRIIIHELIITGLSRGIEWVYFLVSFADTFSESEEIHECEVAVNCLRLAFEFTSSEANAQMVRNLLSAARFKLGIALAKSDKIKEATHEFKEAVRMNPELPSGFAFLAESYLRQGRVEKAIQITKDAINQNPDDPEAHFIFGTLLNEAGRFLDAIKEFRKAIKLNPSDSEYFYNLGLAFSELGKVKKALEAYKKAEKLNRKNADLYYEIGGCHIRLRKFRNAVKAYRNAVELNPRKHYYHFALGIALLVTNSPSETVDSLMKAIDLEANIPITHLWLGHTLLKLERTKEAIKAYSKAVKLDPLNPKSYFGLGNSFFKLRKYQKAVSAFKQSLELDHDPHCEFNLGLAFLFDHNNQQAANHFLKAGKDFLKLDKQKDVEKCRAFSYLSKARLAVKHNDSIQAKRSYHLATKYFHTLGYDSVEFFIRQVIQFFDIDNEVIDAIDESQELEELRERVSRIRLKLSKMQIISDRFDTQEILLLSAKKTFIELLSTGLEFKKIDLRSLKKVRQSLRKHRLFSVYQAMNALDSFLVSLSPFQNLVEIPIGKQQELLTLLRGTRVMDGALTEGVSDRFFHRKLDEIYRVVSEFEAHQLVLTRKVRHIETRVEEIKGFAKNILMFVEQNPQHVQAVLSKQSKELKQILLETAKQLEVKDPSKARRAKEWCSKLAQGVSVAADLIQIVTFLTGIQSIPGLANSDIPTRIVEFFKRLATKD